MAKRTKCEFKFLIIQNGYTVFKFIEGIFKKLKF